MTEPSRDHLAARVRARRESLGLRQKDIAARGGPSYETVRLIEKAAPGSPYQSRTLAGLDRALSWKSGTSAAILDGTADPDPVTWVDNPVMPQFEVSPETQALLAQNETAQAGVTFVGLVHRHYGADRGSAVVNQTVLDFVRRILTSESA